MDLLRISATSHGVNYLPEYHAARTGAFTRLGVQVQAWARDPWTGVLDDLAADRCDVALGGLWVPMMYAGRGRDLVAVGQLNGRFPMVVVTRRPVDGFTWHWFKDRTVLVPGAGGTAMYEFTAGLMREAGADPAQTRFVRDLSTDMLAELYQQGLGDAMVADLGTALRLRDVGVGHLSCHLAEVGGAMPNSVYYVRRPRLPELHDRLVALLGGVQQAMTVLVAGGTDPAVLAQEWPEMPLELLSEAAAVLATNGTWSGIRIDPAACQRWNAILHERGLAPAVGYDDLVDTAAVDALATAGND
jgi:NitT/TauT family transport system substrate-binding protein